MAARILGSYGVSSLAWCTLTDEQSKVSILTSSLGCWKRRTLSSPSIWHTIIWSLTSAMFVPLGESFGEHIAFTLTSDDPCWSYLHRSAGVSWFFFNNDPSFGVSLTNIHFFLGMRHFRSKFFCSQHSGALTAYVPTTDGHCCICTRVRTSYLIAG